MADEDRVGSDYDGRQLRPLSELRKDPSGATYDLIITKLTDGTKVVYWASGEYYRMGSDGMPDFNRPVDPKVVEAADGE